MMRPLIVALLLLSINATAQEKRLALVIGNANYDKGALKNPVNDALLMQRTLTELGFEVLLDTNIRTLDQFKRSFRQFTTKRDSFNLGLIYYAGHGIQINGANYLLATNQEYNSESDVMDYAFEVSRIMDYLKSRNKEVNILILDACRDNPFEKIWTTSSRSLDKGNGLAAMLPPSGSLVAYSTQPGSTASDGNGKNSLYCEILTENILKEDLTLNQLFRNVKMEVRTKSEGKQMPNVLDELEGSEVILRKGTYMNQVLKADSLIEANEYDTALEIITTVLGKDPDNLPALLRKGRIKYNKDAQGYDGADLFKAEKLYPDDPGVQIYLARYFSIRENPREAISKINIAIAMDTTNAEGYYWRARFYTEMEKLDSALADYSKVIELDKNDTISYNNRGNFYADVKKEYQNALMDFSKAIQLAPENPEYWFNRGCVFHDLLQYNNAVSDLKKALNLQPDYIEAINVLGVVYQDQGKPELAIAEYEKGISLIESNPKAAALCYFNRAIFYSNQNENELALADYNKVIELNKNDAGAYTNRGIFYKDVKNDFQNALVDLTKAIEIEPLNIQLWYNRAHLFYENLKEFEKAISDLKKALEIQSTYVDAINFIGTIYEEQNKYDLAIAEYTKGIALAESNPKDAAWCYTNRAYIYAKKNKLDLALKDLNSAIDIDQKNAKWYSQRGAYYYDYFKNYPYAIKDLTISLELEPQESLYWFTRGKLFDDYNQPEKAIADYKKALEIQPDYVDAINGLGVVYQNQGKLDLAIAEYEKGIALAESNPEAAAFCYSNRADIYTEQNKFDMALADYNKAVDLDTENADHHYYRGLFFLNSFKDYNRSLIDLSNSIDLDTTDSGKYLERGKLYAFELNDFKLGLIDFEKAIVFDTNDVIILNWIGALYDRFYDKTNALKYYDLTISKIGQTFKDSAWDYRNGIAWAFSNKGGIMQNEENYIEASYNYTKAIEMDVENPERYIYRAWHNYAYLNNLKVAGSDVKKAIQLDKENQGYYYIMSMINEKSNDQSAAIKNLNKAVELSEEDPDIISKRAMYYLKQRKFDLALNDLKHVANKYPEFKQINYSLGYYYKVIDSTEKAIYYYTTAVESIKNDTTGNFLLGDLYFELKQYQKALIFYSKAMHIMELRNDYSLDTDPFETPTYLSDIYYKIALSYTQLNSENLSCEYFHKSLTQIARETRPDKTGRKKELADLISKYCKN